MSRMAVVWALERDAVGSYLSSESPWNDLRHLLVLKSHMLWKKIILLLSCSQSEGSSFGGVGFPHSWASVTSHMGSILLVHLHK